MTSPATSAASRDPRCRGPAGAGWLSPFTVTLPNQRDGAAGSVIQLAQHSSMPRRIKVVSGIRRDEVEALFATTSRA